MDWVLATDIGHRLKDLRKVMKWGQAALGAKMGRRYQQVSNWENNKQRPPKGALEKLADEEGFPIEMFAEGGPMPSEAIAASRAMRVQEQAARYAEAAGPVEGGGWLWERPEQEAEEQTRRILRRVDEVVRGDVDAPSLRDMQLAYLKGRVIQCEIAGRAVPDWLQRIHNEVIEGRFK